MFKERYCGGMDVLVGCDWLLAELKSNRGDLVVLDCHFDMVNGAEASVQAYEEEHIPNAVHCDFSKVGKETEFVRKDLLGKEEFSEYLRSLGVNQDSRIVCYDRTPPFCGMLVSARIWWLLNLYGVKNVALLNGGFPQWKKLGLPTEALRPTIKPGNFTSVGLNTGEFQATYEEVKQFLEGQCLCADPLFFDAREEKFYSGQEKGPLPPAASAGHVPIFTNFPPSLLFHDGLLKSAAEIQALVKERGYSGKEGVITTCELAIKGALLCFALRFAGIPARLFNGGLTEIGRRHPELFKC